MYQRVAGRVGRYAIMYIHASMHISAIRYVCIVHNHVVTYMWSAWAASSYR